MLSNKQTDNLLIKLVYFFLLLMLAYIYYTELYILYILWLPAAYFGIGSVYVLTGKAPNNYAFPLSFYANVFLAIACIPYIDLLYYLYNVSILWFTLSILIVLLTLTFGGYIAHIIKMILLALVFVSMPLFIKESEWAKWHHTTAKQTLTITGIVPKNLIYERYHCGKKTPCEANYLIIDKVKLSCFYGRKDEWVIDKWTCQDIFDYIGQKAHFTYLPDDEYRNRIFSIQINGKELLSHEQAIEFYTEQFHQFWRNFFSGIFLITLPFVMFYFWARKMIFRQPEPHSPNPKDNKK